MQTRFMQELIHQQTSKKISWFEYFGYCLRLVTGMGLGLILSVASQEIWGLGKISTLLIVLTCVSLILRLTKNWSFTKIIILAMNIILFFVFIHTYIKIALG